MSLLDAPVRQGPGVRFPLPSPATVPGLIALLVALVLGALEGGFPARVWYPAGLFLLALLVLNLVLAPPTRAERSRLFDAALVAYALFCGWSYLSILWADVPGDAWEGANKALVYGLALALVGLRPWRRAGTLAALGLLAFGTVAIAVAVLVVSAVSDDPSTLFLEGRLADPVGYSNATASLWLIGFWPALHLARSRLLPWPAKAAGLAGAALLLQTAVLSQSRGALIGFGVSAALYLALVSRRWPSLIALATVVGITALNWDQLVSVRDARAAESIAPALADARGAIVVGCLAAALLGAAGALVGRRLAPALAARPDLERRGNQAFAALAAVVVVVAAVAIGSPGRWLDDRWEDFKSSGYERVEAGKTRFGGSLGSNRYDFYRVSLNEFRSHPVTGIGASNFAVPYLAARRSSEAPRYPHSFVFQVLGGLGIVGSGLFLAFLALALAAAARAASRVSPAQRGLAAAALAGFAAWFAHGAADWLWEFPALGIAAFSLLGVAARGGRAELAEPRPSPAGLPDVGGAPVEAPPAPDRRRRVLLGAFALIAALSLALPGIAARFTNAAYEGFRADPEGSLARLDRAASLNFLSAEPLVAKGVIAQRLGQGGTAREALEDAARREPKNWFVHFELGLVELAEGNRAAGSSNLQLAAGLNPRQPLVGEVRDRALRGEKIDPTAVELELYQQLREKLRATDPG